MDFQAENAGSGIIIGKQRYEGLAIRNGGAELLRITSLTIEGEGFSIVEELPTTIATDVDARMLIGFTPPDAGRYGGTLRVVSNAQNAPRQDFALSACGVAEDAGTTTCPFP